MNTNQKIITIVKDFSKKPYGRYLETDGVDSGECFRDNVLVPALHKFEQVHVNLTGYNRYDPSFIDEAFGGLIRESGFTGDYILRHLTYEHQLISSIDDLISDRIMAAIKDTEEQK